MNKKRPNQLIKLPPIGWKPSDVKPLNKNMPRRVEQPGIISHKRVQARTKAPIIEAPHQQVLRRLQKCDNLSQFIQFIQEELKKSSLIYNQFLQVEQLLRILAIFTVRFITKDKTRDILNLILDFMMFCKGQSFGSLPLRKSPFTENYPQELAQKWLKIKNETFLYNASHLKILSFIVQQPTNGKQRQQECFQQLKFNLEQDQYQKVAAIAHKMSRQNMQSFSYLSNYLLISCQSMEKKGIPLKDITAIYQKAIQRISQIYKPGPDILEQNNSLDLHKNFMRKDLFSKFHFQSNLQDSLDNFIMEKADESVANLNKFSDLVRPICEDNGGFRFKAGVKISKRTQRNALLRIKQKLFSSKLLQTQLTKLPSEVIFSSLDELTAQQKKMHQQKLLRIFQNCSSPLQFTVDDMLRGKCLFADILKINQCCSAILSALHQKENEDLTLIKLQNRLRKPTRDISFKILFGTVIGELQLALNFQNAEYEFNHKLYELKRSIFFSPLVQLSILNEQISTDYLTEVKSLIDFNSDNSNSQDFNQITTFSKVSKSFDDFLRMLPLTLDDGIAYSKNQFDQYLEQAKNKFKRVLSSSRTLIKDMEEVKLLEGKYFTEIKSFDRAEGKFTEALRQIDRKLKKSNQSRQEREKNQMRKAEVYKQMGNLQRSKGNLAESVSFLLKCLQIQQKLKQNNKNQYLLTLIDIGTAFQIMGNYEEALQFYSIAFMQQQDYVQPKKESKVIDKGSLLHKMGSIHREKSEYKKAIELYSLSLAWNKEQHGQNSEEVAFTLSQLGLLYLAQGDCSKAHQYLQKNLQILQRLKGKGSLETAKAISNLGLVYEQQLNNEKALEKYNHCLQTLERVMGKYSVEAAKAMSNIGQIYHKQGDYLTAFQFYKRSLDIKEGLLGEGNIEEITTLNNIGALFIERKDYAQSRKYFMRSLLIEQKHKGESQQYALIMTNIGHTHLLQENYRQALVYLLQSIGSLQQMESYHHAKNTARSLSVCLRKLQLQEKAQELQEKYELC